MYLKSGSYDISLRFSEAIRTQTVPAVQLKATSGAAFLTLSQLSLVGDLYTGRLIVPSNASNNDYRLAIQNLSDLAGNIVTMNGVLTYHIDTVSPVLSFAKTGVPLRQTTTAYTNTLSFSETNLAVTVTVNSTPHTFSNVSAPLALAYTLPEGSHSISATGKDVAGNVSAMLTQTVVVDLTPPTLAQMTLASQTTVKAGTYPVTLRFSEKMAALSATMTTAAGRSVGLSLTSTDNVTYTGSVSYQSGDDGQSVLSIVGTDEAGNPLSQIISVYTLDTVSATVTTVTQSSDMVQANGTRLLAIQVGYSEPVTASYKLSLPSGSLVSGTWTTANSTSGTVTFTVPKNTLGQATLKIQNIIDGVGNTTAEHSSFTTALDAVAPDLSGVQFVASTNQGVLSNLKVTGVFSEAVQAGVLGLQLQYADLGFLSPSAVTYGVDGKSFTAMFSIRAVDEILKLRVTTMMDMKSNLAADQTVSLGVVDNTKPVISQFGANTATFSAIRNVGDAAIVITMNVTEDYQRLLVRIYDNAGQLRKTLLDRSGAAGFVALTAWDGKDETGQYLSKGWYTMRAYAVDVVGNEGDLVQGLFEITEQHLDLLSPVTLAVPYSFMASGPRQFAYTLVQRTDVPNITEKPGGIRLMSASSVAKITEKIYRKNATGPDTLIATLVTDQATAEFGQGALGTWNGRLNNNAAQAYVDSGRYYVLVTAKNMKDIPESELQIPFQVDHVAPQISAISGPAVAISTRTAANTTFTVSHMVSDNMSTRNITAKLSYAGTGYVSEKVATASHSISHAVDAKNWNMTDGAKIFELSLQDEAQNIATAGVTVVFDSTVPVFSFTVPSRNAFVSQNIQVTNLSIQDATPTTVQYKLGTGSYGSASTFITSSLNKAESITVKVTDQAGNLTEKSQTVTVDNTILAPSFTIAQGSYTNTTGVTLQPSHSEAYPHAFYAQTHSGAWTGLAGLGNATWTLPTTQGSYVIGLKLEDKAGNVSAVVTRSIVLDTTVPVVSSVAVNSSPLNIAQTSLTVTSVATDSLSGVGTYDVSVKNAGGSVVTRNVAAQNTAVFMAAHVPSDGVYTIESKAVDRAGNVSAVKTTSFIRDTTAPVISSVAHAVSGLWQSATSTATVAVSVTDVNPGHVEYTLATSAAPNTIRKSGVVTGNVLSYAMLMTGESSGSHLLKFRATDLAGNTSAWTSVTLLFDITVPVLSNASLGALVTSANAVTLTAAATDGHSGVARYEYRIDSLAWTTFTSGQSVSVASLTDGSHVFSFRAVDAAGNISNVITQTMTLDRAAPTLGSPIVNKTTLNLQTSDLMISLLGADSGSGFARYEYKIDGNAVRTILGTNSLTLTNSDSQLAANGSHTLTFWAVDQAGNRSTAQTVSIVIDRLVPTLSALTLSRSTVNLAKEALTVTFTGTDPSPATALRYAYTVKRVSTGATVLSGTVTENRVVISSLIPDATYTITVQAIDAADNVSSVAGMTATFVVDTTPPVMTLNSGYPKTSLQQTLTPGAVDMSDTAYWLSSYTSSEPAAHSVRIFSESNQDLVITGNYLIQQQQGNTTLVRWDGFVRPNGANEAPYYQAPEGLYAIEISLTDAAGNLSTTVSTFALKTEYVVGGTDAHTPGVTMNVGNVEIRWGEGSRISRLSTIDAPGGTGCHSWFLGNCLNNYAKSGSDQKNINIDILQSVTLSHTVSTGEWDYYFRELSVGTDRGFGASTVASGAYGLYLWVKSYSNHEYMYLGDTVFSEGYYRGVFGTSFQLGNTTDIKDVNGVVSLYNALNANPRITSTNALYKLDNTYLLSDRRTGTRYILRNSSTGQHKFSTVSSEAGHTLISSVALPTQTGLAINPSLATENSVIHVAWEDTRNGQSQIYYKRFYTANQLTASTPPQTYIFSLPQLQTVSHVRIVSPKASVDGVPILNSTHPTFTWQLPTQNMTENTRFKLELYRGVTGNEEGLATFNIPTGFQPDYQTMAIPVGTYRMVGDKVSFSPDSYDALGKTALNEVYRWQVQVDYTGQDIWETSMTSEVFQIDPPLEVEAPINYPNPFQRTTKIRYKLTKDARSVQIRIFDVAGRLVRVLDDAPTEGTRPFREYNDMAWDGRNGVGDEVLNGVYIYKITAVDDDGNKAEARGKAVKLK
jgi:flagellar hook assembly protein FlgD